MLSILNTTKQKNRSGALVSNIEDDEIETLKNWWSQYGKALIAMTVVGVGGVLGLQAWDTSKRVSGEAASALYEDMLEASSGAAADTDDDNLETTAQSLSAQLREQHADSIYAVLAALHLAKLAVDEEDLDTAINELEWALAQDLNEALEVTVRMRLARLLVAQEKTAEALAALDFPVSSDAHKSSLAEIRGDIFIAMGEPAKARDAYQLALDSLDEDLTKPMLKIKLADIPDPDHQAPALEDDQGDGEDAADDSAGDGESDNDSEAAADAEASEDDMAPDAASSDEMEGDMESEATEDDMESDADGDMEAGMEPEDELADELLEADETGGTDMEGESESADDDIDSEAEADNP